MVGLTGACDDSRTETAGPAPAVTDSSPSTPAPDLSTPAETLDLVAAGGELEAAVHPLVRSGDHVVLTMDLTTDAEDLLIGDLFRGEVADQPVEGGGVRLTDLASKQVYLLGLDAQGDPVGAGESLLSLGSDGLRVQRVYAAPSPSVTSMGVLLPGGYLDEVPVVDGEVPAPTLPTAEEPEDGPLEVTDATDVAEAPVLPLESFTAELDGAVTVLESTEEVTVNLGGDVLFDSSSATLRPDAQQAIDAAARRIQGRAPGTVSVVGHTDDVGDAASNQKLSQRRADAVTEALGDRLDTADHPLEASGEGESEPLVANTSDANRQLNRRVELTLVSEVTTSTEVSDQGKLPPFEDGPVGTGAEGVVIESGVRTWRFTAPEARRVDGSLVLDLQVTAEDDEVDSGFGPGNLAGYWSYRGDDVTVPRNMLGLTVLSGSSAVYPYDYRVREDAGTEVWNPLGELDTLRRVDGGETVTFTAVYPGVGDAETITVQLNHNLGAEPFRLTDIPVVG
ncbi:OmpA family protein [Isoptericola aurantiacus]|uniref:OmpA family protein n=1 Tax=Isoptericola aurantiacus TaxID=3377839 RepID=UPI003839FF0A